ncbi:MAG: hypothetical protein ACXVAX_07450 [Pseudobdellovibrio sp.]
MYKEIFLNFTDTELAIAGFMIFLSVFLGALVWTLFVQDKSFYGELSLQPLENGDEHVGSK